jgi:hypothetical protein
MTGFEKDCLKLFRGDDTEVKSYKLVLKYKSGKTKVQPLIADSRSTAEYQAREYIRYGFAHIDNDELIKATLEESK